MAYPVVDAVAASGSMAATPDVYALAEVSNDFAVAISPGAPATLLTPEGVNGAARKQ
ncbi:MAG: hypothetical protein PW792_15630 [Acidobacteriaceae bacterium]|nr:hypothetical protein [Acidobacteriaceae bacterium]